MGGWYEAPEGTEYLPRSVMELDQWADERGLQLEGSGRERDNLGGTRRISAGVNAYSKSSRIQET